MSYVSRLSLASLFLASVVTADTLAIVDLYKVAKSLPELEQFQEEIQKEVSIAQGKLNNKKLQLDAKIQEFEANQETLSEQKADKMRRDIVALQRELKALEADLREDLAIHEQEQKNMLIEHATSSVSQYAQKNKIDVVLLADQVVYRVDAKDITDAVIKTLSTATVAEPAPAPAAKTKATATSEKESSRRSK